MSQTGTVTRRSELKEKSENFETKTLVSDPVVLFIPLLKFLEETFYEILKIQGGNIVLSPHCFVGRTRSKKLKNAIGINNFGPSV